MHCDRCSGRILKLMQPEDLGLYSKDYAVMMAVNSFLNLKPEEIIIIPSYINNFGHLRTAIKHF